MSTRNNHMRVFAAVLAIFFLAVAPSFAAAIPESDLYYFQGASRDTFKFDSYFNGTASRATTLNALHNASSSYYIVIRANAGDVFPYDDFSVQFHCIGDGVDTFVRTIDYPSWVASGQVSMKRSYVLEINRTYGNVTGNIKQATCEIVSAGDLIPSNNTGYTTFNFELVPLTQTKVVTVQAACEDEARGTLIGNLVNGTVNVVSNNVNIITTFWIVVQIVAIVFIFIGIPVLLLLFIRWVIFKVAGRKILWGGDESIHNV